MPENIKWIRAFTGTSIEGNALGELIARQLGQLDGRSLSAVQKYSGKKLCNWSNTPATFKLIFYHKNKRFSKYINELTFQEAVRRYINAFFEWCYAEEEKPFPPKKDEYRNDGEFFEDDDLPF